MAQYVIDTHPLLWYLSGDERIGPEARRILDYAEAGKVEIIVPAIVLIEAIDILNKKRIVYNLNNLLRWIEQIPQHEIKNLDWEIITLFKDYTFTSPKDSHDKIIIITAQLFGNAPIITKDTDIKEVYSPTIW